MSGVDPQFVYEGQRLTYELGVLEESAAPSTPLPLFREWLDAAKGAGVTEPTAMVVGTVQADGRPSARTVLLRRLDPDGALVFFTNTGSAKGRDLRGDPRCCAVFGWLDLQRQVRVEGRVEAVDDEAADAYFAGRPRGSQIGAWASPQSRVIADRAELEALVAATEARFDGTEVPRPPDWGGYRIVVDSWEFWQGRPSRLHDRLRYRLDDGAWIRDRLAP